MERAFQMVSEIAQTAPISDSYTSSNAS